MPAAAGGAGAWGRALGREHLDGLLRDAAVAAGAQLFQPYKLTGLRAAAGLYEAQVQADDHVAELTAHRVISANGSWEKGVLSPPAIPHAPSDLLAFKALFDGADLPGDLMPLLMFPGGYGGMVRTDGGRLSLSCCIRRDVLTDHRRAHPSLSAGEAVLSHIRDDCEGVRRVLDPARLAGPVLAAGPIRPGIRIRGEDGILRVGNAAGEAHPIIAEGISMAMQSSWLLCRHLTRAGTGATSQGERRGIATAYAADWRGQFAPRIRAAHALAMLAMRPGSNALVAAAVSAAPRLLTWGAKVSGKTFLLQDH